jgi:hypothetical protein
MIGAIFLLEFKVHRTKAMKSSPLLVPLWDLKFWRFSLLNITEDRLGGMMYMFLRLRTQKVWIIHLERLEEGT